MNCFKTLSATLLAILLTISTGFAQVSVKGIIRDNENLPVPFANVAMYSAADSSVLRYGTITDLDGNFEFKNVAGERYLVIVSFMGFRNIKDTLEISKGENGPYQFNYTLEPDAKLLEAATVQESRVKIQSDKTSYSILPSDIKGSRNALDLTTIVPRIIYDPVNDKISSADGKSVKILVNGLNANEIELKTIRPDQIARIEHYDIPPARYADFGSVINIITKVREDGFAAGANLSTAFSTGFGNEMAYFKYNKGRNQIALDYSLYHRNYSDVEVETSYDYMFNQTRMQRYQTSRAAFGYDDNYINLTYSNQKDKDYALKIKLSPNFMTRHSASESQIEYLQGSNSESREGTDKQKASVFGPTADIYFWKQLKNKQELAINIVGTGFRTSSDYSREEYGTGDVLLLEDKMVEKNRKVSLIGEANYSAEFGGGRLNAGYTIETNRLTSEVNNSFENVKYTTSFLKNYLYSEYSGKKGSFTYKASLGLSNISRETYTQRFNDWIFRPTLILGYNFGKGGIITFQYRRYSNEPSIAELSNNKVYVTDHIIREGNPDLRLSTSNELNLDWGIQTKFLDLKLSTFIRHTDNPINRYFTRGDEFIVLAAENGIKSNTYGALYSGTIKPFSNNLFSLRFNGQVLKTDLTSTQAGSYSHLYTPLWYQLIFQYKNWTAQYQGNIVGKYLSGPYLSTNENQSNINVRYTKNNLTLFASCYWFMTKSKYRTVTIPESIVKYTSFNWINDNKSMIVVGLSYNLFKGKKYDEKASKLQNADRDAGIF